MMCSTFSTVSAGEPAPINFGEIQNGTNPDGSRCFYCGPHDTLGCDTPGNACK